MAEPKLIYRSVDIAELFGVSRACVTQWGSRYTVPAPSFVDPSDSPYYLEPKLNEWLEWHRTTINASRSAAARAHKTTTDTKEN